MKTNWLILLTTLFMGTACTQKLQTQSADSSSLAVDGKLRVRSGTGTSTPPATTAPLAIASSTISKNPLTAGDVQNIKLTLSSGIAYSNLLVDIRIYNATTKAMLVRKGFEGVNIAAGSSLSLQYDYQSAASLPVGSYEVQVGVWNSDYSKTFLYETRNPFSVVAAQSTTPVTQPSSGLTSAVSIISSSVSSNQLTAGSVQSIKVNLGSASAYANLLADIRIYNSDTKVMLVRKGFEGVNIVANGSVNLQFDYQSASTLTAGNYEIQVGVWSSDWSKTYLYETRNKFTVVSSSVSQPTPTPTPTPTPEPTPTPAPAPSTGGSTPTTGGQTNPTTITYLAPVNFSDQGFTISSQIAKASMTAGEIQYAKMRITSATARQGLIVSMRYLDPQGNQMIERQTSSGDFYAGETKEIILDYAIRLDAPAGTYSIGIGIWGANWSPNIMYQRNLPNFQVNSSGYVRPTPSYLLPNTANFNMTSAVDATVFNGSYFVQNNMWGIVGLPAGYSSQAGVGALTASGGVQARWQYNYPTDGPNEVKGYPAVGIGQKPGQASTPNSGMPRQISQINSVMSSWDIEAKYTGRGHMSYDLWLTRDGNRYPCFPCTPITHEIMLAVDNYSDDYATSNPAWYFSSTVIDGVVYRVWKADNFGGGGATWRFIVLQMMNPIHVQKGTVNFKSVFNYLQSVGLITGQEYLSSIEFGNEMVYGTGDVFIKDFNAFVK